MRVILAYPYNGYNGGDTVDLPRSEARNLIAIGRARKAEPVEAEDSGEDEPNVHPATLYLMNMHDGKD